jgi:hypothetical protein
MLNPSKNWQDSTTQNLFSSKSDSRTIRYPLRLLTRNLIMINAIYQSAIRQNKEYLFVVTGLHPDAITKGIAICTEASFEFFHQEMLSEQSCPEVIALLSGNMDNKYSLMIERLIIIIKDSLVKQLGIETPVAENIAYKVVPDVIGKISSAFMAEGKLTPAGLKSLLQFRVLGSKPAVSQEESALSPAASLWKAARGFHF